MPFPRVYPVATLLILLLAPGSSVAFVPGPLFSGRGPAELAKCLKSRDVEVRRDAAFCLGVIGPRAAEALPAILRSLEDSDAEVRVHTIASIRGMGPAGGAALPVLAKLLEDEEPNVRRASAAALQGMGRGAEWACLALSRSMSDEDKYVRAWAAGALARLGREDVRPLALLAEALEDDESDFSEVAEILGEIGPRALPTLKHCLKNKRARVRLAATGAFAEMAEEMRRRKMPFPREAVRSLISALKDPDEKVAANAIYALGRAGEAAKEAIPAIAECLAHRDQWVRFSASRHSGTSGRPPELRSRPCGTRCTTMMSPFGARQRRPSGSWKVLRKRLRRGPNPSAPLKPLPGE
jgi:HEAT repeat protein